MTDSDLLENYRHVYFRINQTVYEWGWGLILAKEAKDELHADISTLALCGRHRVLRGAGLRQPRRAGAPLRPFLLRRAVRDHRPAARLQP